MTGRSDAGKSSKDAFIESRKLTFDASVLSEKPVKTRLLVIVLAVPWLVACTQESSYVPLATWPPWGRGLLGFVFIAMTVFLLWAYAHGKLEIEMPFGSRPATENDGCLVGAGALLTLIVGILLIISAAGGKTGVSIANWLDRSSHFYETIKTGVDIAWFLLFEILILVLLIKEGLALLFPKAGREGSLGFLLFWGLLNGAYWTWIFWTHRFEEAFVQPFTAIYHLFFK